MRNLKIVKPMSLWLTNGYPSPWLDSYNTPEDGGDNPYAVEAQAVTHELKGVVNFEWKHTLTIEFADRESFDIARRITGWTVWDEEGLVLEAKVSRDEGYDHPAIVAAIPYALDEDAGHAYPVSHSTHTAYCGFMLLAHEESA